MPGVHPAARAAAKQQQCRDNQGAGIAWLKAIQQACSESLVTHSAHPSPIAIPQTASHERLTQDHPQHLPALRAQGHPDANLVGPPGKLV